VDYINNEPVERRAFFSLCTSVLPIAMGTPVLLCVTNRQVRAGVASLVDNELIYFEYCEMHRNFTYEKYRNEKYRNQ
jgi:hypothetical protein